MRVCHPEKLDTRSKIVAFDTALAAVRGHSAAIVTGYFDPLTAEHVRRIKEIHDSAHEFLIVALFDPLRPVLNAHARAELLAALSDVDFVVLDGAQLLLTEYPIYREEQTDEERFQRLVDLVHHRRHLQVAR